LAISYWPYTKPLWEIFISICARAQPGMDVSVKNGYWLLVLTQPLPLCVSAEFSFFIFLCAISQHERCGENPPGRTIGSPQMKIVAKSQ
jgi:hypothetical protein